MGAGVLDMPLESTTKRTVVFIRNSRTIARTEREHRR